jgi:4a-hydroxytetrahydrobiopterin dehydratase
MKNNWKEKDNYLIKEFEFKNFLDALKFVNTCGKIFEKNDHHPDITIFNYKFVRISTTTHDAGFKLTKKDYNLVKSIDNL